MLLLTHRRFASVPVVTENGLCCTGIRNHGPLVEPVGTTRPYESKGLGCVCRSELRLHSPKPEKEGKNVLLSNVAIHYLYEQFLLHSLYSFVCLNAICDARILYVKRAHLMKGEGFFRISFAVKPAVNRSILPNLVHSPRVIFTHTHDVLFVEIERERKIALANNDDKKVLFVFVERLLRLDSNNRL